MSCNESITFPISNNALNGKSNHVKTLDRAKAMLSWSVILGAIKKMRASLSMTNKLTCVCSHLYTLDRINGEWIICVWR
jgi:hypothetical protein